MAILVASCGATVAKHGSRSVTSKSGSADMFEALGMRLNLSVEQSARLLEDSGFTFMFAQNHHPAMKYIMPIRESLTHRTIFNFLGPLTNPAGVTKQLVGVFSPDYVEKLIDALVMLDSKRAMVVSSLDGMDEISISSPTRGAFYDGVRIKEMMIEPNDYGFSGKKEDLVGGDAKENAKITLSILDGEKSPRRDIVVLNTAAALMVDGLARDMQDGLEIAREAILNSRAKKKLKQIIEVSNRL